MRNIIIFTLISVFLTSCGGIQLLGGKKRSDLYRGHFLKKIKIVKAQYASGNANQAMETLEAVSDKTLWPAEKAFKYNLVGVLQFAGGKYEDAISSFDKALVTSSMDESLTSQIYLNMASAYFKLDFKEKSYAMLMQSNFKHLNDKEAKNYHFLHYKLAKSKGKEAEVAKSLMRYLGLSKSINEMRSNSYFQYLVDMFFKMSMDDRARFLEEFDDEKSLSVAYLAYMNAEKIYYSGEKSKTKDYLEWLTESYTDYPEILELVKNFSFRLDNDAKIDPFAIGVILPLTGKKNHFGQRSLLGIDSALKIVNQKRAKEGLTPLKIYVKDSQGSGAVGSHVIRELIDKKHVAAIIGGLFSSEAHGEYLETKKRGVFFISLSQIYLPKIKKDHLLLEIRGSIESQINYIFNDQMLNYLGRRAAILYPESDRGQSYLEEFWRKALQGNIEVVGVQKYNEKSSDFREPVKKLLGLGFSRGRQEEKDLLSEIYSLESRSSVKRIQVLKPQIDFDWLFLPAYPEQTRLIVPSFSYFDAFKLNFVGGPSWGQSKKLLQESYKFDNLYFIGDELKEVGPSFVKKYVKAYRKKPRILEIISHDSMKILGDIIGANTFNTREEFDHGIKGMDELKGMTGRWNQSDGLWLKNLQPMILRKGEVKKVFESSENL